MDTLILPEEFYISQNNDNIVKNNIRDNGIAFVLYNFVTPEQCDMLIDVFNNSEYHHVKNDGYSESYRDNYRVILDSEKLSEYFTTKITPFLDSEIDVNNDDDDFSNKGYYAEELSYGRWKMDKLNPRFRLCMYENGGKFDAHQDGYYRINKNHQSLKTFMLYLNSDFDGGETRFLEDKFNIKPEKGMILVFNHAILHDGAQVLNGKKYIIRSDIMYKRITKLTISFERKLYLKTMEKAGEMEDQGENEKSIRLYKLAQILNNYC